MKRRFWIWFFVGTAAVLAPRAAGEAHLTPLAVYRLGFRFVYSLAFSPDGRALAVAGSGGGALHLLDPHTGAILRDLEGHTDYVRAVAFTPDGAYLASGADDGAIRLWNLRPSGEGRMLRGHGGGVNSIAISPDGTYLASASDDATIKLWEVATGKECQTLRGHQLWVYAVAFSPDGGYLASGGYDENVVLWDLRTWERRVLGSHRGPVTAVAFSPDGALLASAGFDRTVRLWDIRSGTVRTLRGHEGTVYAVAFSPQGHLLASASADRTVRVWNPATGTVWAVLTDYFEAVRALAFSPDGNLLATGSCARYYADYCGEGEVRLWLIPPHSADHGKENGRIPQGFCGRSCSSPPARVTQRCAKDTYAARSFPDGFSAKSKASDLLGDCCALGTDYEAFPHTCFLRLSPHCGQNPRG